MGIFNRKQTSAAAVPAAPVVTATLEPTFGEGTSAVDDISGDYTIDAAHTRIGFTARHAMVTKVRGQFADFEGTVHIDVEDPSASRAEVVIRTESINTGQADRDGHLRSGDFFDVEQYPEIRFTSTSVTRKGGDVWTVTGDLTIKDVTKPVSIDFEATGSARDPFGNLRVGFEGSTTVNRKDWGLTWNAALETGGVLVSEKVTLEFDVSAIQVAG